MTRINLIPVGDLYDQHLLAEHRELKRIPNTIKSGRYKLENIPKNYTLGTGHVKFFYDKLEFLHKRYIELYKECKKRGFNIENYEESFNDLPKNLYNDFIPNSTDIDLNKSRIKEKYKPNFYKFYGKNL